MNRYSDEELALQYQAGEKGAANEIVDRYWELSNLIALEFPIAQVDVEDRRMEAIQGLMKAAEKWRPGKGTKFKTFAKLAMRRVLIDVYRRIVQKSRAPEDRILSLDASLECDGESGNYGDTVADPLDLFDAVEERLYAEAASSHVLKAHKEVLFGVAQGYDLADVAAYLGIGPEFVQAAMRFNRAVGAVFASRQRAFA